MEYEYSFNVKSIDPYIEYCKKNNYINISTKKENRIVYHNDNLNHIIARITITQDKTILDFKNVNKKNKDLKISKESIPLDVSDINIAKSIKAVNLNCNPKNNMLHNFTSFIKKRYLSTVFILN